MHPWYLFQDNVLAAYATFDLKGPVSIGNSSEGELRVASNEVGLATRVICNMRNT